MDPNATLQLAIDSLDNDDYQTFVGHMESYLLWVAMGGFKAEPDLIKRSVRAQVAYSEKMPDVTESDIIGIKFYGLLLDLDSAPQTDAQKVVILNGVYESIGIMIGVMVNRITKSN